VDEVKVKVTVKKTGKIYHRTMRYAKKVITGSVGKPKETTYFLRQGRGWQQVSEGQYLIATCKESVVAIKDKLEQELRQRVEKEMRNR